MKTKPLTYGPDSFGRKMPAPLMLLPPPNETDFCARRGFKKNATRVF